MNGDELGDLTDDWLRRLVVRGRALRLAMWWAIVGYSIAAVATARIGDYLTAAVVLACAAAVVVMDRRMVRPRQHALLAERFERDRQRADRRG